MAVKKTEKKPLSALLNGLAKKYDTRLGGMDEIPDVLGMSTGNLGIDTACGVNGIPYGRIMEFYGLPSSGKTTLGLHCVAQAQHLHPNKRVAYFDYEHAMDKQYAAALGIDTNNILFAQPDFLEQGAAMALEMIDTGEISLVVFDSVARMTPEGLYSADIGKGQIALQARVMASFLEKLVPLLARTNTIAVFINHLKEVIDISPMGQRMSSQGIKRVSTPGGTALKFYASLRLEFKQVKGVDGTLLDSLTNEQIKVKVATDTRVSVVKNKVAPPFRQALVQVRYGLGFSQGFSVLQVLTAHKIIRRSDGGIFTIPRRLLEGTDVDVTGMKGTDPYIRGENAVIMALETSATFLSRALAEARAVAAEVIRPLSREEILRAVDVPEDVDAAGPDAGSGASSDGELVAQLTEEDLARLLESGC